MEKKFIKASERYNQLDKHVPAPYFRRTFSLEEVTENLRLSVCGLGFYLLYVNGKEITKGFLAPYISNPDDVCYYDVYDVAKYLRKGENTIGVILGNGWMDPAGGYVWDGDKAPWRGAPILALELSETAGEETRVLLTADTEFRVCESPIRFDDLYYGEYYDATKEIEGWNLTDFDDRAWKNARIAIPPRGEMKECKAEPLRTAKTLSPVEIIKCKSGYIYDFGENTAGICEMTLKNAEPGQKITLRYAELVKNGELYVNSVCFPKERYPEYLKNNQKDIYTAKGAEKETFEPHFTYHGFRYVLVKGLKPEQATKELLQYKVIYSDLRSVGDFSCSDETVNTLFGMVRRADLSNFHYFPTDCPHREKNGWTGDTAVSCFHMMLLYDCEASFREWLCNIRKSQNERGVLPGIVPNAGWGYTWGNGPAWDSVAVYLPYEIYRLRGNKEIIRENAPMMFRYLQYLLTRRSEDGTLAIGLGDWASVGRRFSRFETPLVVTDSIIMMDDARRMAEMFQAVGYTHEAKFAEDVYRDMRKTIRKVLLDRKTATLKGRTQTAQAMGLYYGVFEKDEEEKAFSVLVDLIHEKEDSFDCGMLGLYTIFHVLAEHGEHELALHMITKKEYPSYGHLIEIGETALPERFMPDGAPTDSHNHHFFGDISRWFIREIAGLKVENTDTVTIQPHLWKTISSAQAHYDLPAGRVFVRWKKEKDGMLLEYGVPAGVTCRVIKPENIPCRVQIAEKGAYNK